MAKMMDENDSYLKKGMKDEAETKAYHPSPKPTPKPMERMVKTSRAPKQMESMKKTVLKRYAANGNAKPKFMETIKKVGRK